MPTDQIKPPNRFPEEFHAILADGMGERILATTEDLKSAKAIARKYRAFLRSIKAYPGHPLNGLLALCDVGTKSYELQDGRGQISINVNKKINWDLF